MNCKRKSAALSNKKLLDIHGWVYERIPRIMSSLTLEQAFFLTRVVLESAFISASGIYLRPSHN